MFKDHDEIVVFENGTQEEQSAPAERKTHATKVSLF
jgi:hypothetical protein